MSDRAVKFKDSNNNTVYPCPYYPVGSIYLSINDVNPSLCFGGEWEQIKDRFLLGCGDDYECGTTGGSKEHDHKESTAYAIINGVAYTGFSNHKYKQEKVNGFFGAQNVIVGGSTSVDSMSSRIYTEVSNHMPPYLAVYIWKRIA